MLYAILAYHVEADVMSWTKEADTGVMEKLFKAHEKVNRNGRLGPAARLDYTGKARTLRGPGDGTVTDGPFAETKEQIGGFVLIEAPNMDEALKLASSIPALPLGGVEVRPIMELTRK